MMISLRRHGLMLLTLLLVAPGVQAKSHKHHRSHKHPKSHKTAKQSEEKNLRALAKRIDRDAQNLSQDDHIELLAGQYHVPLSVVEDLHNQNQEWGNISITLAMANALSQKDRVHYPDPSDAISKIQSVRAGAKSWTEVARRSGIAIHPIVIATARTHKNVTTRIQAVPTLALAH